MDIASFTSQIGYVLASVLFVSAGCKAYDVIASFGSRRVRQSVLTVGLVVSEAALAVVLLVAWVTDSLLQPVSVCTAVVFAAFSLWCIYGVATKSTVPCKCFGYFSRTPPRLYKCIRNLLLAAVAVVGLFSTPESLTLAGVGCVAVVLGMVIFTEIR